MAAGRAGRLPSVQVRVVDDPDSLAELAAAVIAEELQEGEGRLDLGLAGGGTPKATYARLRDEAVDWSRVDAWLGDERWVPPDHPDNNGRMCMQSLLGHVAARFHPVPWEEGSPQRAAQRYEETLRAVLPAGEGRPRAHLVILGLGEDGHCASLFPDTEALEERHRLYVANWVPQQEAWRLTATLPLLWAARRIVFLVTGAHKAEAVAAVLEGGEPPLPARRVMEGEAEVTWFLDRAAASRLRSTEIEPA